MVESLYAPEEAKGIWVYLEQTDGSLAGVGLELLGKSRGLADELGVELVGVLLGNGVEPLAEEAVRCGADEVLMADHPHLKGYRYDLYTDALFHLTRTHRPAILLLGATPNGRDLAARLAARLRTGLMADCVDLRVDPQTRLLLGITAGFGGGILATIQCPRHRPQMATVRPGVFPRPAPQARTGTIRRVEVPVGPSRVEILERKVGMEEDLTTARVLVIGGGGTRGDFRLLRELADLLGGQLGATRVAVDAGWAPREWQIGQTGAVTRPKLAVVCGASGAMQFTVGIEAAQTVVAVNLDEEAPIFEHADYGIPDDLFTFLPALIDRLRRMKQEGGPWRESASSSA
ncbi:MAG: electron transfer flavoprotein subunit alpha/FixB family protein [Armatimonadota bacterium]|nr:electron transfer flavoprotein subunit alpha/FixB family protein [Armatimonadota bacterium]MDR7440095.1 electron transfer flavoprotein subunit alpha/FixB family protein [Armatimonadota bacterium]MDR7563583.1 electron transfer flavoprotein subunit alpha/FixB family protein [Armatimonadota bacterium]MDR7567807.1 electron transfer flavoprotein subunit alpha/FixB family protein [Armatimonadota bacterium]MDR7602195.1 electron transfer flavoprotein subunit alpha/FixB family protein [Armatimonadota